MSQGTADLARSWTHRGKGPEGETWVEDYWRSHVDPFRRALRDRILALGDPDIGSVLEVGCHCGPNLHVLRKALPHARLDGLDISHEAIAYGQARMPSLNLSVGSVLDLIRPLAAPTHDVILACYVLCYVAPAEIRRVLGALLLHARLGLVIAEPMAIFGTEPGFAKGEWRHDFNALLNAVDPEPRFLRAWEPVRPARDNLNAILTLTRKKGRR